MKKLLILLLLFSCKKEEPVCYLVQTEEFTVWKPNSPNYFRYGKDNTDLERKWEVVCDLKKVDSLFNLGEVQIINDSTFCISIHRVITKNIKD